MKIHCSIAKSCQTLAVLLGSGFVLGLVHTPLAAIATPIAQQNPQPGIFQEPPYNRTPRETAPAGETTPVGETTPAGETELLSQPEPRPDAAVSLIGNRITVQLVNQTGAAISYQVVGDTEFRTLNGRSEVTLRDLPAPTTLTFRRQDQGLLVVTLQPNSPTPGTLIVNLDETTDFAADRTTLNVSDSGEIFLN